jgi:hypothetical protein
MNDWKKKWRAGIYGIQTFSQSTQMIGSKLVHPMFFINNSIIPGLFNP